MKLQKKEIKIEIQMNSHVYFWKMLEAFVNNCFFHIYIQFLIERKENTK